MASTFAVTDGLRTQLTQNLSRFEHREQKSDGLTKAAVALVITDDPDRPGSACLLLTLRPAKLNKHAGQYALPGGKLDANESVFQAARRELEEELGLALPQTAILGRLDDYATRSGFCITPVVIWAGAKAALIPSEDEVAAVYYIPFAELDSPAIPLLEDGVDPDRPVLCSSFPSLGHRMYSPTAAVIYQFREVAMRGQTTRVAHYDQPQFAWR